MKLYKKTIEKTKMLTEDIIVEKIESESRVNETEHKKVTEKSKTKRFVALLIVLSTIMIGLSMMFVFFPNEKKTKNHIIDEKKEIVDPDPIRWGPGEENIRKFMEKIVDIEKMRNNEHLRFTMLDCKPYHRRLRSGEGDFFIKCEFHGRHYSNNEFKISKDVKEFIQHLSSNIDLYLRKIDRERIEFNIVGRADAPIPQNPRSIGSVSGTICYDKQDEEPHVTLTAGSLLKTNQELACSRGDQAILFMNTLLELDYYKKNLFFAVDSTEKATTGIYRGVDIEMKIRTKDGETARHAALLHEEIVNKIKDKLLKSGFSIRPTIIDPTGPVAVNATTIPNPITSTTASVSSYTYTPKFNCSDVQTSLKNEGRVNEIIVCDFLKSGKSVTSCGFILPHKIEPLENHCRAKYGIP